jgi:RimJ/RimL family protein N-acetyltransferase
MNRRIREMTISDVDLIVDYFLWSDNDYLKSLGVDIHKLPAKKEWGELILKELQRPLEAKKLYYVIWEIDGKPVGHSHVNEIIFGGEAYMHLHLWRRGNRQKGNGSFFVKQSIAHYFEQLKLKTLFCQPYALNPAPNKTLESVGFRLIKNYETIPSWINFRQSVNLWELTYAEFCRQNIFPPEPDR